MNDLVSIVVPIYNVEKYLDRCLQSILSQTYKNLEVILVDDGSPDNCPQICDAYAAKDARVKVIHKENAGLGMARNTGIEYATGKFICFFDSDDYIEPDTIESCVTTAVATSADLVIFGYDTVIDGEMCLDTQIPCPPKMMFEGEEILHLLLPNVLKSGQNMGHDWRMPLCAWNKLYSTDVIRTSGWRFVSERTIISEDFYSLTELHSYLKTVSVVKRAFYHYVVNPTSLSRAFRPERFERTKGFYQSMLSLCNNMGLQTTLNQPIKVITFGFLIGAMKQIVNADLSLRERYCALKTVILDSTMQSMVNTTDISEAKLQKRLFYLAIKFKFVWLCFLLLYWKGKLSA